MGTREPAAGLRDRSDAGAEPVLFDCIDFGITSSEEWQMRFHERLDPRKDKGRAIAAVYHPGGTIAVLIDNLKKNHLLEQMNAIVRGDLVTCPLARKYSLIFCDATHDENEMRRHMPGIAERATAGATLIFDDVVTEEQAEMICDYVEPKRRLLTRQVDAPNGRLGKLFVVET